ncbi:Glutathione-regulated potassium-efflux system ancillary protein KefG [Bienertia sinuspersici]
MLVAWIVNTLDASMRSTVRFPDHVKSLSDDLHRYSLSNVLHILELKAKIVDCKQHGRPVTVYFGELRKLQDKLASYSKISSCTCAAAPEYVRIVESELLHQFCIRLDPKNFDSVVATLLMMNLVPSPNVAYEKVISDERKQTVSDIQDTRPNGGVGLTAFGSALGRIAKSGAGDGRTCDHCVRQGHEKERCFELMGWPKWYGDGCGGRASRGSGRGVMVGVLQVAGLLLIWEVPRQQSDSNRQSAPTLSDEQWKQFISAIKSAKPPSSSND